MPIYRDKFFISMKILTEEDVKFKGKEHYYSLKRYFNKPSINDWYEKIYRSAKCIGYVSSLLKKFAPSSAEEAYEKYINSGINDKDKPLIDRGRDYEELEDMAIQWKSLSGSDRPLVDFYDAIILHAVVETYYGNNKESAVSNAFNHFGFDITNTKGQEDSTFGIDLVAKKDENTFLIQVKPKSFFYGMKEDLVKDRAKVWGMQEKGKKKYGPNAWYIYIIYDGDTGKWVMNKKGKCTFRYEELVDRDGRVIVDMNKLCENETDSLY